MALQKPLYQSEAAILMKPSDRNSVHYRLIRRNSVVEIKYDKSGRGYVCKQYHSRYSAAQEAEALRRLTKFLRKRKIEQVYTAAVLMVDKKANRICTEYVPGDTLKEVIKRRGGKPLKEYRNALLQLLIASKLEQLRIDCDPSNIICSQRSKALILVDPLCAEEINLDDFVAVVFLWGLVKSYARVVYKVTHWPGMIRIWYWFYKTYLVRVNGNYRILNAQLYEYIGIVIRWNIQESIAEPLLKRLLRTLILVRIWKAVGLLFRWNLVRA